DARLVDFLCERFGLTTQADELPALSPEERENILDASIDSTLLDSSQRGAGESSADKIPPQNLFLLHDDALAFIKREPRDWSDWKLVANLPYSVASPILVELAAGSRPPKVMVVTLQLEVAMRLMAQTDDDNY